MSESLCNEPGVHPETGLPYSSRHLVDCPRDGARRFGWERRNPVPGARRDGSRLIGAGVAASSYPSWRLPGRAPTIRAPPPGR
ncbi:xanthine dehydrogenase family protein molybdopterin-binding subunit, partial [Streptomyces sp. NPDC001221]